MTSNVDHQSSRGHLAPPLTLQTIQLKISDWGVVCPRLNIEAETPILWPPDVESWLIWKDPDAGKDWGPRRRGQQRMRWWIASPTQWTWVWVDSGSWWWTRRPGMLWFMGSQRVGHDWVTELNWTAQGYPVGIRRARLWLLVHWNFLALLGYGEKGRDSDRQTKT